jgi:uncharacterized membrane protein HdeD (DUF308 family)
VSGHNAILVTIYLAARAICWAIAAAAFGLLAHSEDGWPLLLRLLTFAVAAAAASVAARDMRALRKAAEVIARDEENAQ